jgi:hypothetical protein
MACAAQSAANCGVEALPAHCATPVINEKYQKKNNRNPVAQFLALRHRLTARQFAVRLVLFENRFFANAVDKTDRYFFLSPAR